MQNIVLIGFMGTGKTTVGRLVAEVLGMRFVDMDVVIEERAGQSISAIFAQHGEPHFRALERALVQELSAQTGLVIATGGGVVLNPENTRDYARSGLLICLRASPETILQRTAKEKHRPLLEQDDKFKRICSILEARKQLYDAIPRQIDTNTRTPEAIAVEIVGLYRQNKIAATERGSHLQE